MRLSNFLKAGHPPTLFSAFLYFDISFMVWVLMGVLGSYIAKDFGLSTTQKGLIAALPILGGSLVRIPIGILADRLGPKKTGIIGQLLLIIPLAGGWLFASNFQSVLAFGLFLGIAGGSFAVALPLASRWYPPQYQGMALGIAGAGNSGTVLASLLAPRLAEYFGWRNVFGLAFIPTILSLIAFIILAKEFPERHKPKNLAAYFTILRETDAFWFCFFYSVTFGGFVGLASFLGIFFHDQYGLNRVMAGNFTALSVFAGSFFRPIGGYLADRFGGIRMLTFLFSSIAILMLSVSFLPPLAPATIFMFLGMMSLGMGNGAVFQIIPQRFQKGIGVITGLVGAAGGLGGFFLPMFLGFFKDITGSFGVGFMLFALASLSALVSLRTVQRKWIFKW
jgi:NNP family nitrate/nitrite transporter-like MFS transporter